MLRFSINENMACQLQIDGAKLFFFWLQAFFFVTSRPAQSHDLPSNACESNLKNY